MEKEKLYKKISQEILENIGGSQNIQGAAHCATRLRIVLKDLSLVKTNKLENIDLIKGCFIAGSQLQLILGAGTVNEVYKVFAKEAKLENMSLSDVKDIAAKKQNPQQQVIKA